MKRSLVAARDAYQEHYGQEKMPPCVAKVVMGSDCFRALVHEGSLKVCPWVDGYRLNKDISASEPLCFCCCEVFSFA